MRDRRHGGGLPVRGGRLRGPVPAFDLAVFGAGPAGAAAAATAARAGLSVALIDKARFPRDKLCGGGVTGRARRILAATFGALPEGLFLDCGRIRLVAGRAPIGAHPAAPPISMTMRRAFDAALLEAACAAGAADLTGRRPAAVDPARGRIAFADGGELRAAVVVGADGATSQVARALFGRAFNPARIGFALEVEAPRPAPGAEDWVEIDLDAAAWGYGWAFPKRRSVTYGVGGLHAANPDLKARLAAYLARHGVAGAGRVQGAFLPMGEVRRMPGRGRALLAGDAAGLVDPITGEGIGWAAESGRLAAEAAAAALAAGRPERAAAAYARALAPVRRELARARLLRRVLYARLFRDRCLRLLAREPRLQRRFLALLAGEMDYADIGLGSLIRLARGLAAPRAA